MPDKFHKKNVSGSQRINGSICDRVIHVHQHTSMGSEKSMCSRIASSICSVIGSFLREPVEPANNLRAPAITDFTVGRSSSGTQGKPLSKCHLVQYLLLLR